jgi:hypothetical protein
MNKASEQRLEVRRTVHYRVSEGREQLEERTKVWKAPAACCLPGSRRRRFLNFNKMLIVS